MFNFFTRDSMIFGSQFPTLDSQLRVETLGTSWWFGGLILAILIMLALSVSAHRKQYTLYVRNLLNKQGRVMNYDQELTSIWADVLLWVVVVSSYVLLVMSNDVRVNFFILFVIVAAYLGLKWLLIRFVGYVFGLRETSRAFSTDYFVIVALLGLLILPLICGMIYLPEVPDGVWHVLISVICVFVLIIVFIKLLQIFYSGVGSLFYIFLYLCTSEILPLLVAAKVASIVVSNV